MDNKERIYALGKVRSHLISEDESITIEYKKAVTLCNLLLKYRKLPLEIYASTWYNPLFKSLGITFLKDLSCLEIQSLKTKIIAMIDSRKVNKELQDKIIEFLKTKHNCDTCTFE